MHRPFFVLLLLTFLTLLSGCFRFSRATEPTEGPGTIILGTNVRGTMTLDGRVACTFKELSVARYDVFCQAVVNDNGTEIAATAIAPGLTLNWLLPVRLGGAEVQYRDIQIGPLALSQRVLVELSEPVPTTVRFDLSLAMQQSPAQVRSATVTFPLSVASYGTYPQAPLTFNLFDPSDAQLKQVGRELKPAGFSAIELPVNARFAAMGAACAIGDSIYFSSGLSIYRQRAGKVEIFAGSPAPYSRDASHRLRLGFGDYAHGLGLACLPTSPGNEPRLAVLDIIKYRIAILRESGAVEIWGRLNTTPSTGSPDGALAFESGILPVAIAAGPDGKLYFVDSVPGFGARIRTVDAQGKLLTLHNIPNTNGDYSLAVRADGTFFMGDGNRVWIAQKGSAPQVYAGRPESGNAGDGGPAAQAQFMTIQSVALSAAEDLFVAERYGARIRKISKNGIVSTAVANSPGQLKFSRGLGGPVSGVSFVTPRSVSVDAVGGVLIVDWGGQRITRLMNGNLHHVVGMAVDPLTGVPEEAFNYDGISTFSSTIPVPDGAFLALDGSIVFSNLEHSRTQSIGVDGKISNLFGEYNQQLAFTNAKTMTQDSAGTFYALGTNGSIQRMPLLGNVSIFANGGPGFGGDGGPISSDAVFFNFPTAISAGPSRSVYVTDTWNHRVRRIAPNGDLSTIAGSGTPGFEGDGGLATLAKLSQPGALAVGPDETVFFVDGSSSNASSVYRIRAVRDGRIETIAGGGTCSEVESCEGITGRQLSLMSPQKISVDDRGRVFFVEAGRSWIRYLEPYLEGGVRLYRARQLVRLGGAAESLCGNGQVKRNVEAGQGASAFAMSLSTACYGDPVSLHVHSNCSTNSSGKFTLVLGQRFGDSNHQFGNVIRAEVPCAAF